MNENLTFREKVIIGFTLILAICCLGIVFITLTTNYCSANLLIESNIKGNGFVDQETMSSNQYARMRATNAKHDYTDKRTEDSTGNKDISVNVIVEGAKGTYGDQVAFRNKEGKLGSQEFRASNITNLVAAFNGYIHVDDDGLLSYDSTIDASGNADFYARAIDSRNGKPIVIDRFKAFGNETVWKHLNITEIKTISDWLFFCGEFNDQLTPSVGVVLIPVNNNGEYVNLTVDQIELLRKFNVSV